MTRDSRAQMLRRQLQQLILLRETGPKSAAWHAARTRMIWRLHDEIKRDAAAPTETSMETGRTGDKQPE